MNISDIQDAIRDVTWTASMEMAKQLDALYRKAITLHLGHNGWGIEEIRERLHRIYNEETRITVVTLDGNPILSYGEPAFNGDRFEQKYHIVPRRTESDA